MNAFKLNPYSIWIASILLIATISCKDELDKVNSVDDELEIMKSSTLTEGILDEELVAFDEATISSEGGRQNEDCPTVEKNIEAKTVTIDFGEACEGQYGRVRSGKVIVTYTGSIHSGATKNISFDNYFVNGHQLEGSVKVVSLGRNGDGHLTTQRTLSDFKVIFSGGRTFITNGSTTRVWIEGEGDGIPGNEKFEITGAYDGEDDKGNTFTRQITNPIIADWGCLSEDKFVRVSGEITMTINIGSNETVRVLDYGDGECDNTVTVTINGQTFTITVEQPD